MGFSFNTKTVEEVSKVTGKKKGANGKQVIDVQSAKYGAYYDHLKSYINADGTLKMGAGAEVTVDTTEEARKVRLSFTRVANAMVPSLPLYWRKTASDTTLFFELREKRVGKKTGKRTPKA